MCQHLNLLEILLSFKFVKHNHPQHELTFGSTRSIPYKLISRDFRGLLKIAHIGTLNAELILTYPKSKFVSHITNFLEKPTHSNRRIKTHQICTFSVHSIYPTYPEIFRQVMHMPSQFGYRNFIPKAKIPDTKSPFFFGLQRSSQLTLPGAVLLGSAFHNTQISCK